jgi:predicted enzyme related to lactoylglutathione lyase
MPRARKAGVSIGAVESRLLVKILITDCGTPAVPKCSQRLTMRKPFFYGVGGVVSADIAVPDHEREIAFYSAILTTGDDPLWRDDLTNNFGTPVIGLGSRTPEYHTLPLQWMPHFQVADVAASVAAAIAKGGEEVMHGTTDDGQSLWAVLADPNGAAFGIIPAVYGKSGNTHDSGRLGCISWLSLTVPDASSCREFYQQVVGWTAKSFETEGSEGRDGGFEMQIDDEISAAEIRHSRREHHGIPPIWLIHLPVGDLVESLRRVSEGGGQVVKEFVTAGYAVVRDPVGVYLALETG